MDYESGTWWDHVTGEAVYGPLRGEKMETFNLLHSTVEQALAAHPDIQVAISDRPFDKDWSPNTSPLSWLSQMFERTMGAEDDRVDRMDIGLGVWTDRVHRYYSMADIVDSGPCAHRRARWAAHPDLRLPESTLPLRSIRLPTGWNAAAVTTAWIRERSCAVACSMGRRQRDGARPAASDLHPLVRLLFDLRRPGGLQALVWCLT